jgi:simple sugar transport system permease protein
MFLILLRKAIGFSTVFMFGSTGETITERSGHLNLGIPGIMCLGALGGAVGERLYVKSIGENISQMNGFMAVFTPIVFALLFGALAGLLYCFLADTLHCNQNVIGLTLTTFGAGLANFLGSKIPNVGFAEASAYFSKGFVNGNEANSVVALFLSYGPLVYIAIILSILVAIFIRRTRVGLSLRAVGENPATADAVGINVTGYKYAATTIGSAIAALGGLYYLMDYIGGKWQYSIDAYGWMAVALVIFTVWQTDLGVLGAVIFGMLYVLPNYIDVGTKSYIKELIGMIPYVATVIVLIALSIANKRELQPPAALGLPYFREDR